jgi:hypothetical protein
MVPPTATFAAKIFGKFVWFIARDAVLTIYALITNTTIQNLVIYACRAMISGVLSLTYYIIGLTSSKRNPMVQLVEKEIKEVSTSKIMASKEHDSTRSVIRQSTDEMKIVSMSFVTVILTWIIKTATSTRRSLICLITEHKKNKEKN